MTVKATNCTAKINIIPFVSIKINEDTGTCSIKLTQVTLKKDNYTFTGTNVNLMNVGTYTIKLTQSANLTDVSGMYTIA